MAKNIVVNSSSQEIRVAVTGDGTLKELHIQKNIDDAVRGNIYKGKVIRILPAMQSAFIDIGLPKAGFIHIQEIKFRKPDQNIESVLKKGDTIIVQIIRGIIGDKGPLLTTKLSISSANLVFLPRLTSVKLSQKIHGEEERERLTNLVNEADSETKEDEGNFIIRTCATYATDLTNEVRLLRKLWPMVQQRIANAEEKELVFEEFPLFIRVIRDFIDEDVSKILIDNKENYEKLERYFNNYIPHLTSKLEYYDNSSPIFSNFAIEEEIERALESKVHLKSGATVVFDQAEAMTTIDINSSGCTGIKDPEQTALRINLEAIPVIARQIKLRNLAGILIIDFIDVRTASSKDALMRKLMSAFEEDKYVLKLGELSALCLVEITRKRTGKSLEQILCESCPTCNGRGKVRSINTVSIQIMRDIIPLLDNVGDNELFILAHQQVAASLEQFLEKDDDIHKIINNDQLKIKIEPDFTQEQYDLIIV